MAEPSPAERKSVHIRDREAVAVTEDILRQHINPAIAAICEDLGGASSVSVCTMVVQMLVMECAAVAREATGDWLESLIRVVRRPQDQRGSERFERNEARRRRAVARIHAAAQPRRRR